MTSNSKSFFSIEKFRPYMVFDSRSFIDCSVKKSFKFCSLFILLHLFEMEIPNDHFGHILFIKCKLEKSCMMFIVKNHQQNASTRIGLLVFVPEILGSKVHHALDAQLKLTTTK